MSTLYERLHQKFYNLMILDTSTNLLFIYRLLTANLILKLYVGRSYQKLVVIQNVEDFLGKKEHLV